jgi:hypothetical protein
MDEQLASAVCVEAENPQHRGYLRTRDMLAERKMIAPHAFPMDGVEPKKCNFQGKRPCIAEVKFNVP